MFGGYPKARGFCIRPSGSSELLSFCIVCTHRGGFTSYGCVCMVYIPPYGTKNKDHLEYSHHIGIKKMWDPHYGISFGIEKWWCQSNTIVYMIHLDMISIDWILGFLMLIPSLRSCFDENKPQCLNLIFNLHECHECQIHVIWLQGWLLPPVDVVVVHIHVWAFISNHAHNTIFPYSQGFYGRQLGGAHKDVCESNITKLNKTL